MAPPIENAHCNAFDEAYFAINTSSLTDAEVKLVTPPYGSKSVVPKKLPVIYTFPAASFVG
ncbi:MAG: hypothetical protein IPJ32_08775 [Sphingobacteriaceae bacterium]|nr:hypothetical protein [Sphingobacteriaceae bacterium]